MPRTTNHQYIATHRQLQRLWEHDSMFMAMLLPRDQWYLHDYFRLTEQLSDAELLVHRAAITRARPALPQEAGRALTDLRHAFEEGRTRLPTSVPLRNGRRARIGGVVQPKVDVSALAQVILDIAQSMASRGDLPADASSRPRRARRG